MNSNKGFSLQEQEELNKASNALNLDADTKKLAFAYLLEYKQKTKQIVPEKLSVVIGSAILAAAKSQVITTVKGDTIRGVGISITQLLRGLNMASNHVNLEEFLMALKDFITIVTLAHDINTELKAMIDKFAFSYTFYVKYNALFRQLELEQTMGEHEEYLRCLKNFGWLIYINARSAVLQGRTELVESVFLLAANLSHIVYNMPKEINIPYFEKNGKNIYIPNTQKKNEDAILEGIFELLKLNNNSAGEVHTQQKSIQDFLKKLVENGVLQSSQDLEGVFDREVIFTNFEKLDAFYSKKLGFDDLDERFFVSARKNIQAGMFTPFAKQGSANKISININITKNGDLTQSLKKTFPQTRMLNYDVTEQVSMRSNLHDIRFANATVPASPFLNKLPPATPVTRALEVYNWLSEKVRTRKNTQGLTPLLENYLSIFEDKFKDAVLSRANNLVEKVLSFEKEAALNTGNAVSEKKISEKHNQMVSLYFKVLEELLGQEERKTRGQNFLEILSNENFHKALIACSIETVFFVHNASNVNFTQLLDICDIQAFEFWRIIGSFVKFDMNLPAPLKKHLYNIELKILMCLAWRSNSAMHKLIKKFIEESKGDIELESPTNVTESMHSPKSQPSQQDSQFNTPQKSTSHVVESSPLSDRSGVKLPKTELTHSQELFFKRVLHHTALIVYQMTDLLGITEKVAEQIWGVMKYLLSSETTLLIDRHIDQLILCSIYGVSKVLHSSLKFQDIIAKYQELPSFDKAEFIENIHQVYISETETADLIKFYNTVYISQMKTYLFALSPQLGQQLRPGTPQVKKPLVPALVMDSPLRESLPQPPTVYTGKSMSAHSKPSTPMMRYGMTPRTGALYAFGESPSRALETINNFASKRQINFDDSNDNAMPTGDAVKKTKSSSILEKIIEQRGEDNESEPTKQLAASQKNPFGSFPAQSSVMNKFSTYEDSAATFAGGNTTSSTSGLAIKGFTFPRLMKVSSIPTMSSASKMSVEENEQNPQQSQSPTSLSPESKPEQNGGFKKVQKKNEPMVTESKV